MEQGEGRRGGQHRRRGEQPHCVRTAAVGRVGMDSTGYVRFVACLRTTLFLLLMGIPLCGSALPLDVDVGLGGMFVPGLPTPVTLSVEQQGILLDSGEWVLEQQIGDPWRGEATMRYRFPAERTELKIVVPIYDFTYPLSIHLFGPDGDSSPLAETTLNLRSLRVSKPYSLTIGAWPRINRLHGEDAWVADVAVADLPVRWWAYVGISSIWLGTTTSAIPGGVWEAIERWVLAGGRLVLTTGTSFYLVDSPEMRRLLPIRSPSLVGGRLCGDLKPGAQVWDGDRDRDWDWESDSDTEPHESEGETTRSPEIGTNSDLAFRSDGGSAGSDVDAVTIVSQDYGAGRVILVDRRADELPDDVVLELLATLDEIPYETPTEWLSGTGDLGALGVQRPGYPTTILVALAILGGLLWSVFGVRLAGWKRLLGLGIVLSILTVWSGLHVNIRNQAMTVYAEKTALYVGGELGIRMDRIELFALATAECTIPPTWMEGEPQRSASAAAEGVAVELLPLELEETGRNWGATWIADRGHGLIVYADRAEKREVVFLSDRDATRSLAAAYTGDERLWVNNPGRGLMWAIAAVDGEFYDLGELPAGESLIQLEGAALPEASVWGEPYAQIGAELEARFRLSEGAWLIAGSTNLDYEQWGQARAKVRQTEVYVVVADSGD
ncbi:hypothetical protein JW848_06535 [Candidatus Bipolaricaulota bacterium]|nr:hypothetical protein [Candidatus Bipolaricaulota bacterium]